MALNAGMKLGPYEILSPLGAGGMGEVYRAKDMRLDREVAIKVLPERLANDADALARFEREAKAVAALSHPNILAIHDVGHEHGISFVITELLEGETLRERLHRSAISWRQAVEITVSVADGLSAAHAKGVIHRDLKPENIFITTAGHVKILDFGLARKEPEGRVAPGHAPESTPTITLATRPGAILGTLNYMSPEQVRGLRTDGRSDIFSLGCVVYEMIAGRRAFTGDTPADTMIAILKEEPAGITDARTGIRPELERVIVRCLEKKPEQRFQSAPDLAFTLRSLLADTSAVVPPRRALPWYAKAGIVAVVIVALLVGAFLVRRELRLVRRESGETIDSLAVLPFENVSRDPDQEYFVDGITEALISNLAKIKGLKKVISRTSVMRYKATTKSLPEIAKELKVDAVVEGSVLCVGDRVRITAQLIHAVTEKNLWADSYDRDQRDVLRLQSEAARTIAQEIKVTLTPQEQARLTSSKQVSPEAHEAYLKGRYWWNKRTEEGLNRSLTFFREALNLDPTFALSYAGIADSYVVMGSWDFLRPHEAYPKAKEAATKGLEIDETLAEAHASLAAVAKDYGWDFSGAEREFNRAIQLNPGYATAHQWYAEHLAAMGRHEEAMAETKRALELDPLSLVIRTAHGRICYYARQYDLAIDHCHKALQLDPNFAPAHVLLSFSYVQMGMYAEAVAASEKAIGLSGGVPLPLASLGYAHAMAGNRDEALRVLEQLTELSQQRHVTADNVALVYAGLGEKDQAFEWLEKAAEEHSGYLAYLKTEPLMDGLRSDPRFDNLLRRIGLDPFSTVQGSGP